MAKQRLNVVQAGGIGFRARRTTGFTTTANTQTSGFVFDTADYNYGGGYNTSTGEFTAPVTGSYQFSGAWDVEAVGSMGRAFTVFRGTAAAIQKPRANDFTVGTAGNQSRFNWTLEIALTAGQTLGFDIWTSAATNVGRATSDTWVAGHLVQAA